MTDTSIHPLTADTLHAALTGLHVVFDKHTRDASVACMVRSGCYAIQGGFDYKRAIVDSIISIIEENSEAKEAGLAHLCEFIEDCEHTVLATRILHLLGREGPRTPQPFKYVRFIYNRVILENPAVRAGLMRCFVNRC